MGSRQARIVAASTGAALSLFAAIGCVWLLGGALLGYDALPGGPNSPPPARTQIAQLPERPIPRARLPAPPRPTPARRPRPRAVTPAATSGRRAHQGTVPEVAGRVGSGRGVAGPRRGTPSGPPSPVVTPAPTPSPTPTPTPTATPQPSLRGIVSSTGRAVRDSGRTLGGTVGEVSEPVGEVVTGVTDGLGSTVEQVAGLLP